MIIFVRHAKTKLNSENLIQTTSDNDILNPTHLEIKTFKSRLKNAYLTIGEYSINNNLKVITSEYKRTKQTAEVFGFYNISTDSRINELDLSGFEFSNKDLLSNNKQFNNDWNNDIPIIGVESKSNFYMRLVDFLNSCKSNQNYLVFSHGLVIRSIISICVSNSINFNSILNKIKLKNLGITVVDPINLSLEGIYNNEA